MTLRQYIRRRVALALAIAFVLLIAVGIVVMPNVANGNVNPLLSIAAIGLATVPSGLIYFAIRCPKCSKRIFPVQIANQITFPWLNKIIGRPIQQTCPNCGVNLDEPMPTKLIS